MPKVNITRHSLFSRANALKTRHHYSYYISKQELSILMVFTPVLSDNYVIRALFTHFFY
jgi:hypothetical protein